MLAKEVVMSLFLVKHSWDARKEAVWHALSQRARFHENYGYGRIGKWLHIAKAIICLVLNPRRSLWADSNCFDSVAVWDGMTYSSFEGTFHEWTELVVGHGWGDWHFDIFRNGD